VPANVVDPSHVSLSKPHHLSLITIVNSQPKVQKTRSEMELAEEETATKRRICA
jgi:hypothetical protein